MLWMKLKTDWRRTLLLREVVVQLWIWKNISFIKISQSWTMNQMLCWQYTRRGCSLSLSLQGKSDNSRSVRNFLPVFPGPIKVTKIAPLKSLKGWNWRWSPGVAGLCCYWKWGSVPPTRDRVKIQRSKRVVTNSCEVLTVFSHNHNAPDGRPAQNCSHFSPRTIWLRLGDRDCTTPHNLRSVSESEGILRNINLWESSLIKISQNFDLEFLRSRATFLVAYIELMF